MFRVKRSYRDLCVSVSVNVCGRMCASVTPTQFSMCLIVIACIVFCMCEHERMDITASKSECVDYIR